MTNAYAGAAARFLAVLVLAAAAAGCSGSAGPGGGAGPPPSAAAVELVGGWRVYSETLFYDTGGSGGSDAGASATRELSLNGDGTCEFGSSNAAGDVTAI